MDNNTMAIHFRRQLYRIFGVLTIGIILFVASKKMKGVNIVTLVQQSLQDQPGNIAYTKSRFNMKKQDMTTPYKTRLNTVSHFCERHRHLQCDKNISSPCNKGVRHNLLVDTKHKIIYCPVPKAACSTIKYRLAKATTGKKSLKFGNKDDLHTIPFLSKHGLFPFHTFKMAQQEEMISSYFKFMFVRDPFQRLVSAYRDKLITNDTLFRHVAQRMAVFNRKQVRTFKNDLTFLEFLKFIVFYNQENGEVYQEHWRPYHMLCDPCVIQYDFIGTMEHFYEDSKTLDELLMDYCNLKLSGSDLRPHATNTTSTHVRDYFRDIPSKVLKKLDERLYPDMSMFGYTW